MSFIPTTNYALQKPVVGTELDAWGDDLNTNLDLIDTRMKINADAAAAASTLAGTKANTVHAHAAADVTSGTFPTARIADGAITNAKLANMAPSTIKGCLPDGVPIDLTGAQAAGIIGVTSTIADNSVTNVKLADMAAATIKGSVAGGDPADLTGTQVTTLLNAFTTSLKGVVPASGGGTSNFMRADGTWAAPATSSIADDSVTNAKLANMAAATIKGSVAGGDPADLTATETTSLLNTFTTSLKGVVPPSGGGTANYMRADGTWATPSVSVGSVAWGAITGTLSNQTDLNTALVTETPNAQTGTSYTLVAADAGKMVTCNNGGATFTLTVNSSVFAANSRVDIIQLGAAQVTFAGSATRRANPSGANKLTGQYSGATLWFISASEYVLFGDITT